MFVNRKSIQIIILLLTTLKGILYAENVTNSLQEDFLLFYVNTSAALTGVPLTDDVDYINSLDVTKIDVVPYISVGVSKHITENLLLNLEYSYWHNINNPTYVDAYDGNHLSVEAFYDLSTSIHGIYSGIEYYYTKKLSLLFQVGINYIDTGGDLTSNVNIFNQNGSLLSTTVNTSNKYNFGFKIGGNYNILNTKNLKIDIHGEYFFIPSSSIISVSVPPTISTSRQSRINVDAYPKTFHTGVIQGGTLGLRFLF